MSCRKTILVFVSFALFCGLPLFAQTINIGGSDTLILLGQRLVESYRASHPTAQFVVLGGGRGEGIEIAQSHGSATNRKLVSFPIAVEAVVIYVNRGNPVRELSVAQVRGIFLGQITNWKEVGGPDGRITLYAGEGTTGTLEFFQESVLHGEEPYPFEGKNNTHALLEVIAAKPEAIG